MYQKAYGIIETLAPLHVGASAGEETGNLNLIFRDQFTQTGIIPGSSIRGRFRANMRSQSHERTANWYGHEAVTGQEDGGTTEAKVKFEYASLVWLPVFCPGQPIVWVTCPWLLKRYKQITGINAAIPAPYSATKSLEARDIGNNRKILFFNLGFLKIEHTNVDLSPWLPDGTSIPQSQLVVVDNNDIAMIHDMALYRQSRVALEEEQKKAKQRAFFNVEALPEGSVLIFPIALREPGWQPFGGETSEELYFGGLESIGFGRCQVIINGEAIADTSQQEAA
ncbi:MAG: RAMP superfamily CRISPR-associated protein [Cyanophyceae cyanobacterium]